MSLEFEQERPNINFSTDLIAFSVEIFPATTAEKYKFVSPKNRTLKRFPYKYNFKVAVKKSDEQEQSKNLQGTDLNSGASTSDPKDQMDEESEVNIEEFE